MFDWRRFAGRLPTRFELQVWCGFPDAGLCVVSGPASNHLVGVDIDTDDPIIRGSILAALPPTTVSKRGQKGDTRFFRGPNIDKSKSWNINKSRVCDLIGPGRQTVVPGSIHPDTQQPYVWTGPDALEDIDPAELPELTPEHIEAIDAALARHGFEPEPGPLERRAPLFECTDTRRREYALAALHGCAEELAAAQSGTRNAMLNALTYRLGRMAARGWLAEDEIGATMWAACLTNGLAGDGEHQFRATFQSGLRAGLKRPAPDPRERLSNIDPKLTAGLKPRAA
jgi:hypothetical protein